MTGSSTPAITISDPYESDESPQHIENDLAEASSKNPSILLELDMLGVVKHLSKSWESIVGTSIQKIKHHSIYNIILGSDDDKNVFTEATRIMMTDDTSYRVRFVVSTNDIKSDQEDEEDEGDIHEGNQLQYTESNDTGSLSSISTNGGMIELEGQGILIHNSSLVPTHSMWILKPSNPCVPNFELPSSLSDTLGFGSEILNSYLVTLSELGIINESDVPPPTQVLCRICEQQVPSWWLEKHSQLCLHEHKRESDVQFIHDSLLEQKSIIQAITESLAKESQGIPNTDALTDYKGLPLPKVSPHNEQQMARSSTPLRRARSGSIFGYLRFPFKTLELLTELCDNAIQINTSEFNEENSTFDFSPHTKDVMLHVLSPNIPSSSDPAINLISSDTEKLVNKKVDAVNRLKSSLVYSQKIKNEVDELILLAISETIKNIRNQTYSGTQLSMSRNPSGDQNSHISKPSYDTPDELKSDRSGLLYPKPSLFRPNIFTDSYIGTDSLPSPTTTLDSKQAQLSPSRSITPNELMSKENEIIFPKFNELALKSPTNTPKRKPSPGIPPNSFMSSPMSSIQRNSKSHGYDSVSGTAASSPLILAHEPYDTLDKRSFLNGHDQLLPPGISSTGSFSKAVPVSPLLVAIQPSPVKPVAPSIKDYEILKPISKGAFGSVYLTRRKVTGDYFAIKVLKKSDMISKNQVTNIKAERAIMMAQSDSPYVAKLFSSFQSKDYLFLVMEYLPGGDCSTLVKMLGNLPDEWAKRYIAQVIVEVEDLHKKGIVHHDLKPDNLLIDSSGHLKLTDFGLSRMGLIHRQERSNKSLSVTEEALVQEVTSLKPKRKDSITTFALSGSQNSNNDSHSSGLTSPMTSLFEPFPKAENHRSHRSDSQGSIPGSPALKPLHKSASQTSFAMPDEYLEPSPGSSESKLYALFDPENSSKNKKFVGTPDYLAPETISGLGEKEVSDWWSVGCILFEFLFGYPPFHDHSPELVFQNILSGKIDWPDLSPKDELKFCTPQAKDLIQKLLVVDPEKRLGNNGAYEIKAHPYFESLDWDKLWETEGSFVPSVEDPESTEYFESRGAKMNPDFSEDSSDHDDDDFQDYTKPTPVKNKLQIPTINTRNQTNITTALGSPSTSNSPTQKSLSLAIPSHLRERRPSRLNESTSEFGSFQFRNLPALEKANKDAINRIKAEHREHRGSISSSSSESIYGRVARNSSSGSPSAFKGTLASSSIFRGHSPARGAVNSANSSYSSPTNPNSTAQDDHGYFEFSGRSSPSTDSGSPHPKIFAKPSTPVQRRQRSRGSRGHLLQRALSEFSPSSSDTEDSRYSAIERVQKRRQSSRISEGTRSKPHCLDVLLCEPIPILRFQLKKELEELGCAVVAVTAGDELIRRATGQVKFDIVVTVLKVPKLDIIDIVKLLRHTSSVNSNTPIIAITAYYREAYNSGIFSDVLEKPVSKRQLQTTLERHSDWRYNSNHEEAISDTEAVSDTDII